MTGEGRSGGSLGETVGGVALVVGPVTWLAGLCLRFLALHDGTFSAAELRRFAAQPFAAPSQLAAYQAEPGLVTAGYALFAVGAVVSCFAVAALARVVAARAPVLGVAGGTGLVLGLLARVYVTGVEQTAFRLVDALGLRHATDVVMHSYVEISYGPWWIAVVAMFCGYAGALLLAVGALRSGTFGLGRVLVFLFAQALFSGVLKESTPWDVATGVALCVTLAPLGLRTLRRRPDAPVRRRLAW